MGEIGIDIDEKERFDEKEYVDEKKEYEEKVAISPDGSIVATFHSHGSYITITKVATNEKAKISFDKPFDNNILGWSLAVSDIIDNNTGDNNTSDNNNVGFVAISCITNEDMSTKGIEKVNKFQIAFDILKQFIQLFFKIFIPYCFVFFSLILIIFLTLPILLSVFFLCLIVLPNLYYLIRLGMSYYVTNKDDLEQFQLSWNSGKGITQLFKFSFNDDTNKPNPIHKSHFGGVIGFLKNSKNSAILICTNCIKIQKIYIRLNKNDFKSESYLLPENLFEKLVKVDNAKLNWKYLSKSRYQEFLIIDIDDYQKMQNIEIYDINTLQLVNVFYRCHSDDYLVSRNNEPGIFAISTDSRLFAYSYGSNIITIYLMESGLEVVSKRFDNVYKIKVLEFIEEDKKLFIIEQGKCGDVKFHIWIISGCLNDYFSISKDSKDDIGLSNSNIPTFSKYDEYFNALAKANGKVVFKIDGEQFRVVHEITTQRTIFGENDAVTDEPILKPKIVCYNSKEW
ncbi:hypothetical protein RhiirA4_515519 [Rhizophagus irregularis]|uniref:Uncharacterized protein n=1 Tax=Rhizophagus irregularis TaxID=588596 RepID=A0A2I1HKY7_9GLOM|nr:hypothetical protein RhiirA4_515519 [Rhizophagus irregularis]